MIYELTRIKNRMLNISQRLGKSLMLPVAVLPAAAILVGLGYWMDPTGFGDSTLLSGVLVQVGMVIMDNIPILFAAGVSLGMATERDGSAVLAGILGYLVVIRMLSPESVALFKGIPLYQVSDAFYSIGNQFTGILSGLVGAYTYNRYSSLKLPEGFSFFAGKRSVPIISTIIMVFVSMVLYGIWPMMYEMLIIFGTRISSLGALGAGIYGFLNRLLIPLGLHHPLNSVFWFDVIGINDIGHFWKSTGVYGETGMYLAGYFPIMMFGLPGAALAMSRTASRGQIRKTRSFMGTSAFASFLTGITEPLEFSFMFVAPRLYFLHAVYTGLSLYLAARFRWIAGFSFSAGLTDFLLSMKVPMSKDMGMLILMGVVFFFLYYFSFTFFIRKYNILTPGRELKKLKQDEVNNLYTGDFKKLGKNILKACGGRNNIISIDSCITRLRLEVHNPDSVNEKKLQAIGVMGVIKQGPYVQIIIGPQVHFILEEMKILVKDRMM